MPAPRAVVALTLTLAAAVALSACSSSSTSSNSSSAAGASKATTATSHVVNVTVSAAKGCVADATRYAAGALTFKITNTDATAVSEVELISGERIVGEKENLPPGFSGTFSVNVPSGSYVLYCPGATPERTPLKVVGKSSSTGDTNVAALLKTASAGYATYVNTQVSALVTAVNTLNKALQGTSLKAAQKAYIEARPYYEKIEPVAESFVIGTDSIDADIDVRIGDTTFAKWRGFHRIEYGLFKAKSLKGLSAFGTTLVADVARLKKLTAGLTYQPTELATGAQGLLDEVAATKITGEEEAYSLIDLLDFANNDEAAEQAFAQLQPALTEIDPVLTKTIQTEFAALDKLVNTYRTTSNASGYKLYNQLTAADKRQLAAAVKAVAEPLSSVSSKVANA